DGWPKSYERPEATFSLSGVRMIAIATANSASTLSIYFQKAACQSSSTRWKVRLTPPIRVSRIYFHRRREWNARHTTCLELQALNRTSADGSVPAVGPRWSFHCVGTSTEN